MANSFISVAVRALVAAVAQPWAVLARGHGVCPLSLPCLEHTSGSGRACAPWLCPGDSWLCHAGLLGVWSPVSYPSSSELALNAPAQTLRAARAAFGYE